MFLASKLQFSRDDVLDVGVAALYHDIGKLAVGRRILRKKGRLEEAEFGIIKEHPYIGARILYEYRKQLGILPLIAAFEHHLRYDLEGYPKVAFPRKLHIGSLIISIADVYDALAQRRSYKQDYPPDKIYRVMSEERGKLFDPQLFDRFFQIMGVWPLGSLVELSDGRIAVVTEVNENQIWKPKVRIFGPQETMDELNVAKTVDVEIVRALNPKKEGKEYWERLETLPQETEESDSPE
jgi:HD-GYP domain-containing protein (c-di-GMP phosphodiesterase class II)